MVKVGDAFVATVDGHGVLHEVVGADAEEFHFLGKLVGDEGGGGEFDHAADFDVMAVGHLAVDEFFFALFEEGVGAVDFVDLRDHGIHEADVAVGSGAEDGAELGFEELGLVEA